MLFPTAPQIPCECAIHKKYIKKIYLIQKNVNKMLDNENLSGYFTPNTIKNMTKQAPFYQPLDT